MPSRRRFLAASSVAMGACAGCLDNAAVQEIADAGGTDRDTEASSTETADTESRIRIAVADGDGELDLATGDDAATVGDVEESRGAGYGVPVRLTDDGTQAFVDGLEQVGAFDDPEAHGIRTYFDGERVYTATLGNDLAARMEAGEWDGRFVMYASSREEAERLRDALVDG